MTQPGTAFHLSEARLLEVLRTGRQREEHGYIAWGSNTPFLITLALDDLEVQAVYKPRAAERPLWDFPEGTLCLREVAARELSQALGWGLVPPTVLRDGERGPGSCQLFIEHDPQITWFDMRGQQMPQLETQLRALSLFDHIANNADRKGGHCLLGDDGRLWGIDHGLCFHHEPKLRTVIQEFAGEEIPSSLQADLRRLRALLADGKSDLRRHLAPLLTLREQRAMGQRVEALLAGGCWPQPRQGFNIPWPPV